tara:strand:+ start:424 stop:732 length:309 start_codon:yes stop_codon:yes gene_type:complete
MSKKRNPSIDRALKSFRSEQANSVINRGVSTKDIPEKDIALAISFYIFMQGGCPEDYTAQKPTFGGRNRVLMTHEGWTALTSHCTEEFISNLKTNCPWVKID